MPQGRESARGRVLARAGLGILTWVIPPGLVDEAVGDGLAREMRVRSLPSRLGVYFVLGCALLSAEPYPDMIRRVTRRLCPALSPGRASWPHLGGLLLVAVDGTIVAVADSPENAAAFGRPGTTAGNKPADP